MGVHYNSGKKVAIKVVNREKLSENVINKVSNEVRLCVVLGWCIVLSSESASGKCAKLHTVAASNNRDHPTRSLCYCLFAPRKYRCYFSRTSLLWWIARSTQRQL